MADRAFFTTNTTTTKMNTITKITGTNVKVPRVEIDLSTPVTIVTGDNASGKSAIADAYILATTGQHPDLLKTNQGIMEIACDDTMMARVESEQGTSARMWERAKSGSVKATVMREDIDTTLASFSEAAFVQAPAKARIAMISEASDIELGDASALLSAVQEAAGEAVCMGKLPGDYLAACDAIQKTLEDLRKGCKRDKIRWEKMVQGTAALSDEPAAPPLSREDRQKLVDEFTRAKMAVEGTNPEDIEEALETMPSDEDYEQAHALAEQAVLEGTKGEAAAVGSEKIYAKCQATIVETMRNVPPEPEDIAALKGARDALGSEESFSEAIEACAGRLVEYREQMSTVANGYGEARAAKEYWQDVAKVAAKGGEHCPLCDCADADWGERAKAKIDAELAAATAAVTDYGKSENLIMLAIQEAQAKQDELKGTLERRRELDARIDRAAAATTVMDGYRTRLANLYAERDELEDDLKNMKGNLADLREKYSNQQQVVKAWEAGKKAEQVEAAAGRIPDLARRLEEDDARVTASNVAVSEARRIREATEGAAGASEAIERLTKAVKLVEHAQHDASKSLMATICQRANQIGAGVIQGDVTNWGLDIRVASETRDAPFATLSGSEKMIVATAIKASLAGPGGCQLLVVDEIGRVHPDRRQRLLENLADLVEQGIIGRVLAIMPGDASELTTERIKEITI